MVAIRSQVFGETLDQLQRDLGLSAGEMASALGMSLGDLERSVLGEIRPSAEVRHRLGELMALYQHLHETFKPEGIPRWLRAPNRYIGSVTKRPTTPAEAITIGEFDWVEGALVVIDYGIFV